LEGGCAGLETHHVVNSRFSELQTLFLFFVITGDEMIASYFD